MSRTAVDRLRAVSTPETLSSKEGIVDLWYFFYERIGAELLAARESYLTPSERDQCGSFRFERDRERFLATRVSVRSILSKYSAVSPADWRFGTDEHGKPLITAPEVTPTIHFNLANAPGLVVCAVSVAHGLVGVDVERIDRKVEAVDLADRYFSKSETSILRALPACDQLARFFTYWTLKESYVKARGLGLDSTLDRTSFLVEDEISVVFDSRLGDDPKLWRFAAIDVPPHHTIAISVKTGGAALSLRTANFVPLGGNAEPR